MTAQKHDEIDFEAAQWMLWGDSGTGLFAPQAFGFDTPFGMTTACWRGYCCTYAINQGQLELRNLEINMRQLDGSLKVATAPLLNGRGATLNTVAHATCGEVTYLDVGLPIAFSGGLLLGRQWLKEIPVSFRGSELVWRFEQIRELVLEGGQLIATHNRSQAIAQVRDEMARDPGSLEPKPFTSHSRYEIFGGYEAIRARINNFFIFDY